MTRARVQLSAEADAALRQASASGSHLAAAARLAGVPEATVRTYCKRVGISFVDGRNLQYGVPGIVQKLRAAAAEGLTAPQAADRHDIPADRVRSLGKRYRIEFADGNKHPILAKRVLATAAYRARRRRERSTILPPRSEAERHYSAVKAHLRW